jgi:hypothetical protein
MGRRRWKIAARLSQRSYVESTNRHLKTITGDKLAARTFDCQKVEVRLCCKGLDPTAVFTWKAPILNRDASRIGGAAFWNTLGGASAVSILARTQSRASMTVALPQ